MSRFAKSSCFVIVIHIVLRIHSAPTRGKTIPFLSANSRIVLEKVPSCIAGESGPSSSAFTVGMQQNRTISSSLDDLPRRLQRPIMFRYSRDGMVRPDCQSVDLPHVSTLTISVARLRRRYEYVSMVEANGFSRFLLYDSLWKRYVQVSKKCTKSHKEPQCILLQHPGKKEGWRRFRRNGHPRG